MAGTALAQATIDVRVAHDDDDAEEDAGGSIQRKNHIIELGQQQWVGLRFRALGIPQGALISEAYIEMKATGSNSEPTQLTIFGEDADDPPSFSDNNYDLSNRTRTSASVAWSNVESWTSGQWYQTPNIKTIVQEIVGRPGFASDDLVILIRSDDLNGKRLLASHDDSSSNAALLHIVYGVEPNVYYVRPDGDDGNSGTGPSAAEAWRTVREATRKDLLLPGDVIYVKAGTYTDRLEPDEDGILGLPIRVIADSTGSVSGWPAGDVILTHSSEKAITLDGDDYWTFEGFKIQGTSGREAIKIKSSAGIQISRCEIYDAGDEGIRLESTTDVTITNCLIRNSGIAGIYLKDSGCTATVWNCTIVGGADGILQDNGTSTITNCIIANHTDDGFDLNSGTMTHTYNLLYGNGSNFEGTSQSTGELTSNPQFTDPSSDDYTLSSGSPAINAGTNAAGIVDEDFNKLSRPIGTAWEMGFVEYPLVGEWKFDEGSGTTSANEAGGPDATLEGGADWEAARCANAVTLDGSTDWVDLGQFELGTKSYSVGAWFKTTATSQQAILAATADGTNDHALLVELDAAGHVQFSHHFPAASSGGTTLTSAATYRDGVWHYVTAVKSTSELRLYVDGELVDQASDTTSVHSSVEVVLGRHGVSLSQQYFRGSLDEVALYGSALSASDIADILGMVGRWRLDETSGTTAFDSSPLGNHGTYQNGVNLGGGGPSSGLLAADFDGYNDYVELPMYTSDFSGGFTITVWGRPTASNYWARFVDFGAGQDQDNFFLSRQASTSTLEATIHDGSLGGRQPITKSNAITNNAWRHYAVTVDAAGLAKLYVDGAEVASGTIGVPSNVMRDSNFIARSNWAADDYFEGQMHDVRIYKRALCTDEVHNIYRSGAPKGVRVIRWHEVK